MVTHWFNNAAIYSTYSLRTIMEENVFFKTFFVEISISHIYRERNAIADQLSKEAADRPLGDWQIDEHTPARIHRFYHRPYIDGLLIGGSPPH